MPLPADMLVFLPGPPVPERFRGTIPDATPFAADNPP